MFLLSFDMFIIGLFLISTSFPFLYSQMYWSFPLWFAVYTTRTKRQGQGDVPSPNLLPVLSRPDSRCLEAENSLLNLLPGLAKASGPVLRGDCAIGVSSPKSKGWLFGGRDVWVGRATESTCICPWPLVRLGGVRSGEGGEQRGGL